MEHARLLLPTRNSSTRKLLHCGIEVVMSQAYGKEALLRDPQSVSLGSLVAPACHFLTTTHSKTKHDALFSYLPFYHCSARHLTAKSVCTTKKRHTRGFRPYLFPCVRLCAHVCVYVCVCMCVCVCVYVRMCEILRQAPRESLS